jgi:cytidylate kinase
MESRIQEFRENQEKKSDLIVCVCGPSGAGKGTLGKNIADKLGVKLYSAGDFFRKMADDRDLTVEELSEQADKQTDLEVDRRTLEKGLNEDCVIESRISAWVIGSYADFTVYVTADLEERAKRVKQDLKEREAEETGSLEEVKQRIRKRDRDNRQRYMDYYNIDMKNSSFFDLVIDNTEMTVEEQNQLVEKALKEQFPEQVEEAKIESKI